jgi:hypothetical protein
VTPPNSKVNPQNISPLYLAPLQREVPVFNAMCIRTRRCIMDRNRLISTIE